MKNLKEVIKSEKARETVTGLIYLSSLPLILNPTSTPIGLGIFLGIYLGSVVDTYKRNNNPYTFFPVDTEDYEERNKREVADGFSLQLNAGNDYLQN